MGTVGINLVVWDRSVVRFIVPAIHESCSPLWPAGARALSRVGAGISRIAVWSDWLTGAMNGAATALSWKPSLLRHADLLGLASLAFCFASGLLYKSATRRFALLSFRGISKRD